MAEPYSLGSEHSLLFFNKDIVVSHEYMRINILGDSSFYQKNYFARYSISYELEANQAFSLPLLFIAINLKSKPIVKLNGKVISLKDLKKDYDQNRLSQYPFIKPYQANMLRIFYDKNESKVINIDDLVYFETKIIKGKNTITVEYDADLESNNFGYIRDFTLDYALFPSKYWKAFGPIDIKINVPEHLNIKQSSIGSPSINGQNYSWVLNSIPKEDLKILFTPKISVISKILIAVNPFWISVIFTVIMIFIHYKKIKKHRQELKSRYNWSLAIGNLLIPVFFYTAFFLSYDLIDWTLGDEALGKYGYVGLTIFTLPVFWLIYSMVTWAIDISFKRKFKPVKED